jgi:hypothetical protein
MALFENGRGSVRWRRSASMIVQYDYLSPSPLERIDFLFEEIYSLPSINRVAYLARATKHIINISDAAIRLFVGMFFSSYLSIELV